MQGVGRLHYRQPTFREEGYSENPPPKFEIYFDYFQGGKVNGGTGLLRRGLGGFWWVIRDSNS